MKSLLIAIASLALAATLAGAAGDAAQDTERQLKAAMNTELVDGNLKLAIEQYKRIAESSNRALAAQALVRLAECYQKLGDKEAQTIYQRLVRDYGDQKEAVTLARERLAGADRKATVAGMALRKVWGNETPPVAGVRDDTQGAISADGRYMTYVGEFNSKLFLRDLESGADRPLTDVPGPTYASAIAKDGSAVVFNWCTMNQVTCELRIAALHGTGVPLSRSLFGDDEVASVVPQDWSPDGKWIAVSLLRKDKTGQIGIVAASDGALRVLKSVDWRGPGKMFFSPDGRDIAYDLRAGENAPEMDVFVLAVDGSRDLTVASHPSNDRVMGWTPDGKRLLFSSDRSGTNGLWAQAFAERQPQGRPDLVKPDLGPVSSMGVTRSGALHMQVRTNLSDVEVVAIDLTSGTRAAAATRHLQRFTGSNSQPAWSPEGRFLAYVSRSEPPVLTIRATDSAEVRELQPRLSYFTGLSWSPDGRSFAVYGSDLKGRAGVFRIDARSGDVAPIIYQSHIENLSYEGFSWSPDGTRMYYHGQRGSIYEVDMASGSERVLIAAPSMDPTPIDGRLGPISVSPDGRWIASSRSEAAGKAMVVVLLPMNGGSPRDLLRINAPDWVNNTSMPWTPDGRAILVRKMTDPKGVTSELWLVPIDGSAPKKLDFDANHVAAYAQGRISLHPDGGRLAYVAGTKSNIEVWVLDNFLPAPATAKPSGKK
jgi:Tol biopolymer transport system component